MRFFNTTGPIRAAKHYCIPPLERLNLAEVLRLIRDERYFVLHAPRQTGKTSALLALRDLLNGEGHYRCAYINVEVGQAAREDTQRAMQAILGELALRARQALQDEFVEEIWVDALQRYGPDGALRQVLNRWAAADPRPLVLLIDEIDALVGDTLVSVLRQLRAGYDLRPEGFPQSVVLCGVRDVRDYRIQSTAENAIITGGSAFNIKARSLRLGDFSQAEVLALLGQHTEETGQVFTADCLRNGLDADPRAAVAGQCAGRRSLFLRRICRDVGSSGGCRRHPRRARAAHPAARDASRPTRRQAQGGAGAAGG